MKWLLHKIFPRLGMAKVTRCVECPLQFKDDQDRMTHIWVAHHK